MNSVIANESIARIWIVRGISQQFIKYFVCTCVQVGWTAYTGSSLSVGIKVPSQELALLQCMAVN